ncbi:ABC transporter substrate-binding protein [Roseivirga seohaensis subsp. aquiponti]|uniref:ABC transporter substrate-binding protein n=1 Tax=Roseivirga seohaensis subsp. aquiponti TaxID=1566026 RepID=A0A0L8AHV1_9BACT|nr:ABC transporter substrate-binding protein [Roseivirga seohaensis]KOF01846.1 ABC transporter substrate-binding protein [Roseivirga seohaensis subsp. aquiponti]
MKKLYTLLLMALVLTGCGRFSNKDEKQSNSKRIVCLSKQYNEIIFELNAQQNLVAVDLSSTYPPEIKALPTVGYHRALSTEGILSMEPTMIIHDNNVGPEQVMQQMEKLQIPMMVFKTKGDNIPRAKALVTEMGKYFGREKEADSLNAKLDKDLLSAENALAQYTTKPKVVVIHYGRATNVYLTMTENSTTANLIEMAGGTIPINGDRGMMQLSAEVIAKSNPDVILLTDFGYDRLGTEEQLKSLPGVSTTNAAKNNRIYRVEEHDMVYFGPRTGEVILKLQELIHRNEQVQ